MQCFYNISKKKLERKFIFLHADKHQSFQEVNFNTLCIKRSYKGILSLIYMIKHSQSTQSNNFAISLQYFKIEVKDEVHFCTQINSKVSTSWYYFDGRGQTCPNCIPQIKIGSWEHFCIILRKKCHKCSVFDYDVKIFRYFMRVQSYLLLLIIYTSPSKSVVYQHCIISNYKITISKR